MQLAAGRTPKNKSAVYAKLDADLASEARISCSQAHPEGGVAGGSAPGPGGSKGALRPPSKNLSWCEKR